MTYRTQAGHLRFTESPPRSRSRCCQVDTSNPLGLRRRPHSPLLLLIMPPARTATVAVRVRVGIKLTSRLAVSLRLGGLLGCIVSIRSIVVLAAQKVVSRLMVRPPRDAVIDCGDDRGLVLAVAVLVTCPSRTASSGSMV